MRFLRAAGTLVAVGILSSGAVTAHEVSQPLQDLEITDIYPGTCTVNGEERHSLSADFSLPISVNQTEMVRDGVLWDVFASINASGSVNGTISGFVSGTLDDWTLGLQGSGSATINISIPVTGYRYRGIGRRRQLVSRSFGYLSASVNVELSDIVTLTSQCRNGEHGSPNITTQPPIVRTTISIHNASYTGPLSVFPRLRARIESSMRTQFTQQILQQVASGTSQYQSKRDSLIREGIAKLPEGCLCLAQSLPFIGNPDGITPVISGTPEAEPSTPPVISMLDCYRDYTQIHANPSLHGICRNSTSGICYRYSNGDVHYNQGSVRCEE